MDCGEDDAEMNRSVVLKFLLDDCHEVEFLGLEAPLHQIANSDLSILKHFLIVIGLLCFGVNQAHMLLLAALQVAVGGLKLAYLEVGAKELSFQGLYFGEMFEGL